MHIHEREFTLAVYYLSLLILFRPHVYDIICRLTYMANVSYTCNLFYLRVYCKHLL